MEENVIQINGGITINVDASVKNVMYGKKILLWNPASCRFKNCKHLANIMDDSVITCDEVIESCDIEAKTVPFIMKKAYKTQNFYILLAFL